MNIPEYFHESIVSPETGDDFTVRACDESGCFVVEHRQPQQDVDDEPLHDIHIPADVLPWLARVLCAMRDGRKP